MLFYSYLKYKVCGEDDYSDRTLSRELGISEIKVRNLKRTCYARYEDAIDFPKLLISLTQKDLNLMFFKIYNDSNDILCRISVSEVVYYDELRTQLNNSGIHFKKDQGSNYVELSMAIEVNFLDAPFLNFNTGNILLDKAMFDMFLSLLSYIAQNEREKIRERQRQGIAAAKAKGVYKGRPTVYTEDSPEPQKQIIYHNIVSMLKAGDPVVKIAKKNHVARETVYKIKRKIKSEVLDSDSQLIVK